jgi:proline dehydrogenase
MMRATLLYLSSQPTLRRWMETSSLSRPLTKRFVAGMTLDEEISVVRRLNAEGILATLDRLGESVQSMEEAAASRASYIQALDRIAAEKLEATISIKLTQFGLDFGEQQCLDNVRQLVGKAKALGNIVEVDMEASPYVDATLRIVHRLHQESGAVRAVVQAYLYRTFDDTSALCEAAIPVRLVKGAYKEPHSIAFPTKAAVDSEFARITHLLLDRGTQPAIASHDEKLLEDAERYAGQKGIGKNRFEFQMLYGIRRDLQNRLVQNGYRLRLYVPYGDAWYPYFMRRLAERPANVFFLMRNLVRR